MGKNGFLAVPGRHHVGLEDALDDGVSHFYHEHLGLANVPRVANHSHFHELVERLVDGDPRESRLGSQLRDVVIRRRMVPEEIQELGTRRITEIVRKRM